MNFAPGSIATFCGRLECPAAAYDLSALDHIKVTLVFEKAGTVNVQYDVRPMGVTPGGKDSMPGMQCIQNANEAGLVRKVACRVTRR